MKIKPYRKRTSKELEGMKVELLRDMQTKGGTEFKQGEICEVICKSSGLLLSIDGNPPRCIRKVSFSDVRFLEP